MEEMSVMFASAIKACNGGLFVSSGQDRHPARIIDSYEILFVRSGVLEIAEEGHEFTISQGEYLLLYPQRKHWGIGSYSPGLSFYWLHFYVEGIQENSHGVTIRKHGKVARPEQMTEYFRRFIDDQESDFRYVLSQNLVATLLLCEAARPLTQEDEFGQEMIWAGQANAYISTHMNEQINRNSIAEAIGCNADYLGKIYLRVYRKKISVSIHDCRIKFAMRQLIETDKTIEEIAQECGYADLRCFRQQFKLRKDMTPYAYRKMYAMTHINTQ